ncbi:FtsK/SpoIIIE domain-containing protein [Cellulomonas sp. PhB150]|uniref:FtsK/SpoIIIE domain-containing protein n=1 Tax=Cellulomonas sp. PhB150 TaxID=2485188 RepID=UPI000F4609E2|nr:FtsK/SpoIIIE domain-containing protein [Cellulomonas sp. PhB150]ROS30719.1 S-DNA-T family DNA segregation ATPase FtsK/SpoIIIE [Cellulomonas sp. PhB150]
MRLILSVAVPGGAELVDVVAECASGARVSDLAAALAGALRFEQQSVVPAGSGHLGVVQVVRAEQDTSVPLWWRGRELDATQTLEECPLRHGHLVGLGRDVADPWDEPFGTSEIRVVSGRGAGRVHRLAPGHHAIGSGRSASVRLDDAPEQAVLVDVGVDGSVTVSAAPDLVGRSLAAPLRRRPLEGPIVVRSGDASGTPAPARKTKKYSALLAQARGATAGIEELDPEADRPFLHLGRLPLSTPRTWETGASLVVGDTVLELAEHEPPDASLSPSPEGATLDFNRPPRLLPPARTSEFRLPAEPRTPDKQPFPLMMMLLPVVMGGAMLAITHSAYSLIIMALSPLMALSNWLSSRKSRRGQHVDAVRSFTERTARIEADAYAALTSESAARRRELPDPATVLLFATGPRSRLWERRRTDPDWMLARVGTADVASEVSLRDPARDDHDQIQHWTAADVPVAVPLARVGVTGVAGSDEERRRVAGWMVAQVAASHSPADVTVVLLSEPGSEADWRWVRWLPHLRRDAGPLVSVGNDDETTARRVAELLDLVERRRAASSSSGGFASVADILPPPVLVVLDGARRIRLLPGLVTLLREGPAVGVLFLCLDEQERQLPEECQAVVRLDGNATTVSVAGKDPVEGVRADLVDGPWLERLSRALSPIRDISTEDLSSTLPSSSRLLDVLHLDPPQASAVAQGWAGGGRTTRAVIGETGDGLFTVDISADGPHGLVAGTTGSGKSELLQTLIASLAVGNRPDEMTFVLVDYKGGAAFKDCKNLPHTVGMVTDLDTHLTTRALESLAAELRRREHQLAGAGAKDIEDYLATRGPHDDPMPRLLIVIDEFAALVAELPDFVTGLVDIARRGRSLGVHLLLATQRPAGVVSAEIKSNTNLRIALRVTDRNDSQDVIEGPEAAEIAQSLPGRAYARLGHSSLAAFQASRVGGRPPSASRGGSVAVSSLAWAALGRPVRTPGSTGEDDVETPTDLASLVTAVQGAADLAGVAAPPPPWLPALPAVVTIDELGEQSGTGQTDSPFALPYGLVDLPSQQRRDVAVHDVALSGHLAVVGGPRSGRSTTLRTFAAAIGRQTSPRDVHLYGVDCGNNALLPLVGLPHTGAVVTRDQPERLARLTRRLRAEISRRQRLLAEQSFADVTEQRANVDVDERLPYVVVLLDRWEGFVQAFEDYDSGVLLDLWTQILQEGPGAGVKVILSGDRSLLNGRISTLTEDRVMLRMPDAGDYSAVGMTPRQVPGDIADGRAFRSRGSQELQVCVLDPEVGGAEQVAALQRIARDATTRAGATPAAHAPFRVDDLPTRITLAEARALGSSTLAPTAVPAGVGGDSLTLFGLEAEEHGPGVLVVGPRRSGRSTTLLTMASSALERGWLVGTVTPRRSPLRDLAGTPGIVGELTLESTRDEIKAVLEQLVPADGAPTLLVIDDLELLGTDGVLADAVVEHVGALRDRPGLVVAGGTTDELSGSYRGPAPALKKSRSGLLLSPSSPNDGDVFGLRLPRSVIGAPVPGRGILSLAGAWQSVQVPVP